MGFGGRGREERGERVEEENGGRRERERDIDIRKQRE